jgi:acetylornithine deacetylase
MESVYNFHTQSTLKPTQVMCEPGSLNQLPPNCTIQGDIRLAPFYDIHEVMRSVDALVAEINADPSILEGTTNRGPHTKYTLAEPTAQLGKIQWKWLGAGENGVACNLKSKGYDAIIAATESVLGSVKPYSIGGSLPLIRDLQDQGFDVQVAGYGISARYHADNEHCLLSDLKNATRVVSRVSTSL